MKATETHLQPIIARAEQQFIVPLFQRTYSWTKKEWQELWNDLFDLYESEEPKKHFLGSIVTIPVSSVPHGIAKYLLIDGQQRLTTIFILLALIRDNTEDKMLAEKIQEQQLTNKFTTGDDYYKLLPTHMDHPIFERLIKEKSIPGEFENTGIIRCYRFFEKQLKKGNVNIDKLSQIVIHQLSIVSIVLEPNENPHLVFETLNARGLPLTHADLIRNYFFMHINVNEQDEIFSRYWQPMQEVLKENLTECLRHYLMAIKGTDVKKTEVYDTLKSQLDSVNDILKNLKEIATYASYYQKILGLVNEPSLAIQSALERIRRIEVTVSYPFLLNCYHDYAQSKKLTENDFKTVLHYVENLIIRRSICNMPSNALNKLFPTVYHQAQQLVKTTNISFVKAVASILQTKGYPNDDEFKEGLKEANFYSRSEGRDRTKLILESLESSYQHKEQVGFGKTLTIEHIMPQTIKKDDWWQTHLGDEWEIIHEIYLHTLGNLTLTAYNGELSNDSFPEKQKILSKSHLELNHYFSSVSEWKKEQIEERTEKLAEVALQVWAYFGEKKSPNTTIVVKNKVTGTTPSKLIIKDEEFMVTTWKEVLIETLSFLVREELDIFEKLAGDYPRTLSKNINDLGRSVSLGSSGYCVTTNYNADRIYRFCKQAINAANFSSDDWQVDYK